VLVWRTLFSHTL